MQTVDNRFVAVQDQWQLHISTANTDIISELYDTKYCLHVMNNNRNTKNTEITRCEYTINHNQNHASQRNAPQCYWGGEENQIQLISKKEKEFRYLSITFT